MYRRYILDDVLQDRTEEKKNDERTVVPRTRRRCPREKRRGDRRQSRETWLVPRRRSLLALAAGYT